MAIPDEPLHLSAPLAWRLARQLCHKDAVTGVDCAWNHGLWQYLRLMSLGGSPGINAEFYVHAFAAVTGGTGSPRILISGTADYSMLAHVLLSFRQRGINPEVTVVDICETPLALNRWYAERMGCEISTHRCDIFEFGAANGFDAICTHSFLGQIPVGRRSQLLASWLGLLRPGGLAISVDRIRPVSGDAPVGFTPAQARQFCATVLREAQNRHDLPGVDPTELGAAAAVYAARQALHPVRSHAEIRALFESAGFGIDELMCGPNETGIMQTDSGPAIPAMAEYARVIARRQ